jgi:PhoPQ-activated pathogenicity-related protein
MKGESMKRRIVLAVLSVAILLSAQLSLATPLDDYIAAPDSNYHYNVLRTIKAAGCTAYVIEMTSQSWRSEKEVDRTLWQHWLTIVKPDKVTSDIALLWITGGSNDRPAPEKPEQMLVAIAQQSSSVVAELRMVPNQPLNFPDGGRPRYEDGIIAYTFDKYVRTGDATWPLLLPMVKSAVRAMDTIQEYMGCVPESTHIEKFFVSGGSKRGWTTWLTAAVDKRVVAIAPVVIDVLNMDEQMKHHYAAYGFYSKAIEDYQDMNIFARLDTPEGQALIKFIDPYEYRDRYTMPKFLINSSGDQFFLCDSAQFYFHDLPGEKYLRYVPNTDHGLGGSDADKSLLAFYASILRGLPRPKFTWSIERNSITVTTTAGVPKEVNLWQATNDQGRDFRLQTIGPVWKSSPLEHTGSDNYVAKVLQPKKGWTAFFVELVYDSGLPVPYKFTTQVHVVPDTLPFAKN